MKYYKGVQSTYLCLTLTLFSISTKMHSILVFFVAANGLERKNLYSYASTLLYVSLLFYIAIDTEAYGKCVLRICYVYVHL